MGRGCLDGFGEPETVIDRRGIPQAPRVRLPGGSGDSSCSFWQKRGQYQQRYQWESLGEQRCRGASWLSRCLGEASLPGP